MFLKRLASGILLLGLAIGVLYLGGAFLACAMCFVSLCAFRELTNAFRQQMIPWYTLGSLGIFAYYLSLSAFSEKAASYALVGFLIIYFSWYVLRFPKLKSWDVLISFGFRSK